MFTRRVVGVVGSREFRNYKQLDYFLTKHVEEDDMLVSGGATGADSMAQRWAKATGKRILIIYPNYGRNGRGATFSRNKEIADEADVIYAFYQHGRFGQGGTANTVMWGRKLNKEVVEIEEEIEQE